MKNFTARTSGIHMRVARDIFESGLAPAGLKPGALMILNANGDLEPLAEAVTIENKHKVYYCESHRDSVTLFGNSMISAIPLMKQFEYQVEFDVEDENLDPDIDGTEATINALLAIGATDDDPAVPVFKVAEAGEYVIGSIKRGSIDYALGGSATITTFGADFVVPED